MSTPSTALRHKIAKARAQAQADLPRMRACARVVHSLGGTQEQTEKALADLKAAFGSNLSLTTALQLLSGRRGQFTAECAPIGERKSLYAAHLIAQFICAERGLGSVMAPTQAEIEVFHALAASQMDDHPPPNPMGSQDG
jgi:hypothetical protein